jgi:hypothetical protein
VSENLSKKLAIFFNPILQTSWLGNHALTLKNNNAKYYLVLNPVFAYLAEKLHQGKFKSSSN